MVGDRVEQSFKVAFRSAKAASFAAAFAERKATVILPMVLMGLAVVRLVTLSFAPNEIPPSTTPSWATTIIPQYFDLDALVVVTSGPDGAPGQARIDDGGNGVTDERGELGATGSDDVCHVVFGDQADEARRDDRVLVLQRGAFRDGVPGETLPVGVARRQRVRCVEGDGRGREWLVDLAE